LETTILALDLKTGAQLVKCAAEILVVPPILLSKVLSKTLDIPSAAVETLKESMAESRTPSMLMVTVNLVGHLEI